jgi:hypothetical protein
MTVGFPVAVKILESVFEFDAMPLGKGIHSHVRRESQKPAELRRVQPARAVILQPISVCARAFSNKDDAA